MPPWAFCESLQADVAFVDDAEAHHLLHVLRLKPGDFVTLFDGEGTTANAEVTAVSRRDLTCRVVERSHQPADAGPTITMAVSPPKGDRLKWLVEKLTELGVHRLQLMECERTVATPGETRVDKLRATSIAACKQSRRSRVLAIEPLQSFQDVIDASAKQAHEIFLAHPTEKATLRGLQELAKDVTILIGPEGGFTDTELQFASHADVSAIAWPRTVLRIETAAVVFASLAVAGCIQ